VDGVLRTLESYERDRFDAVVSRIKLIAGLDIAERRLPQDGRLTMRAGGVESDVRVSVIPSVWGESIVLRLLPKERSGTFSLDALGMSADHRALFEAWIHEPHGIVLVTGPTGSGKSTTLYTALTLANDRSNKIITVEDPVEFRVPGVTQIQVQSDIGYTFASSLRAILRHDPDIVMVGEIRDLETAQIAVQASLTGHMVFSTLHTNDAFSAVTRLTDMGVEAFLVASSLRGIVAQRLVRRLCGQCAQPDAEADHRALIEASLPGALLAEAGVPGLRRAAGCKACAHTGYVGRSGIYEFVPVTQAVRAAIASGRAGVESFGPAERAHYRGLRGDGLLKAWRGLTSVEEVLRVTGAAGDA
jgi:general secretion pathway protein E